MRLKTRRHEAALACVKTITFPPFLPFSSPFTLMTFAHIGGGDTVILDEFHRERGSV